LEFLRTMRINTNWYLGAGEGSGQSSALVNACLAVSAGLCRHVLVYRTLNQTTFQGTKGRAAENGVDYLLQWRLPFGAVGAQNWAALTAQYHMKRYGLRREQLGQIALNARRNAALNPVALLRDPLTMDDYLTARMISSPLGLYDCDYPCDGSTALVVSHIDTAPDARNVPVHINAVGTAAHGFPSWDMWHDLGTNAGSDAARQMWSRTDLTTEDVDLVQLYDGFTILAVVWLESLGFCGRGEAGDFLEGGHRIALDGELPANTNGGHLSEGRLHGFGFIHEAVLQLRAQAGERQVQGNPEVAALGIGGGANCGSLLLTKGIR